MAEILGLAASIIQIGGSGAKLSKELYLFISTAARADQDMNTIARDVGTTSGVLANVGKVLEADDVTKIINQDAVTHAKDLIGQCEEVFEEILAVLEKRWKRGDDGERRLTLMGRMSWPMKEQRVELLRRRLETLKSSLLVLFYVLQLAQCQARGDVEKTSLEEQRNHIREVHQQQQDSLQILKALEKRLCGVKLDDGSTVQGFDFPPSVPMSGIRPIHIMTAGAADTTANSQVKDNDAAMNILTVNGSDTSESETSSTDEEGEQLSAEELSKCATNVQKLLRRITRLQNQVENEHCMRMPRKRRIHKMYKRFCTKFEADVVNVSPMHLPQAAKRPMSPSTQRSPFRPSFYIADPSTSSPTNAYPFKRVRNTCTQPMNHILATWMKANVDNFSHDSSIDMISGFDATSRYQLQTSPADVSIKPVHQEPIENIPFDTMATTTADVPSADVPSADMLPKDPAPSAGESWMEIKDLITTPHPHDDSSLSFPTTTQFSSPKQSETSGIYDTVDDQCRSYDFSDAPNEVFNPAHSLQIRSHADSMDLDHFNAARSAGNVSNFEEVNSTDLPVSENKPFLVQSHVEYEMSSRYDYEGYISPKQSVSPLEAMQERHLDVDLTVAPKVWPGVSGPRNAVRKRKSDTPWFPKLHHPARIKTPSALSENVTTLRRCSVECIDDDVTSAKKRRMIKHNDADVVCKGGERDVVDVLLERWTTLMSG